MTLRQVWFGVESGVEGARGKRDGQERYRRFFLPLFVKSATKLHLRYRNVVIEITPKRTISSTNPIRDYFLSHHGFGFVLKSQKEIKNINSFR